MILIRKVKAGFRTSTSSLEGLCPRTLSEHRRDRKVCFETDGNATEGLPRPSPSCAVTLDGLLGLGSPHCSLLVPDNPLPTLLWFLKA